MVTGIVARLAGLPRRAVVLAEDETHLNLLPHVRASWTLRGLRPGVLTPGTNRKVTVLGAVEVSTGAWVYRLGRRCAADFIALLDQVLRVFPRAPAIVVICDNDSIHHARKVTAYLKEHPRLELLYRARYSPHDNPADNHASDQHYGPIDRVHIYPYRSSQDRVEAVPRIRVNRDAVQARCLEINATASERSYCVAATDGNGKRDRAEGRARCYNCSGAWGIC